MPVGSIKLYTPLPCFLHSKKAGYSHRSTPLIWIMDWLLSP